MAGRELRDTIRVAQDAPDNIDPEKDVNLFLLFNLGNLFTADQPILLIGEKLRWRVPVIYSLPGRGQLGQVGELAVDVETGEIIMEESQPSSFGDEFPRGQCGHIRFLISHPHSLCCR